MENKTRLIDANAMREDWLENGVNEHVYDTNAVLLSIDEQPTIDAVEVVRCKECRWVRPSINEETGKKEGLWCPALEEVKPDDFCSYGERKDENETA